MSSQETKITNTKLKNLLNKTFLGKHSYKTILKDGYYGSFGGAFVPEMLVPSLEEIDNNYLRIINSEEFEKSFQQLLKDYVGRPSPLFFAKNLSNLHQTNIFLKREDLNHTGSHKINNAIGQALIAKKLGKKKIIAETGAGQHGVATATICSILNLECIIFMGEVDVNRQSSNVSRMQMLGAEVVSVRTGSKTLKDATNEAIRYWINHTNCYYLIGSSVGPHPYPDLVSKLQSIIGKEIRQQLNSLKIKQPNYLISCVGGGSNSIGAFYEYLDDEEVQLILGEAAGEGVNSGKSAATSVLGKVGIIHGSKTLLMQDEDGQILEPYSISAGLDYPGIGPFHSYLIEKKRVKVFSVTDEQALESGFLMTRAEGIIPALETSHAIACLNKIKFKKDDVVVVNLSGRGDKDIETYNKIFFYSQ